jgi:hypothetical protein
LYRWRPGSISRTPEAFSRDLKTLKVARVESKSLNSKTLIDFKVISMMLHALISRDQYHREQEAEIVNSFSWIIRVFNTSLKYIDHVLPLSLRKMVVRKQQKIRDSQFKNSDVGAVNCH